MHGWGDVETTLVAGLGAAVEATALLLIPLVLLRRKEPSSTIAWILTLVFVPALGAALFLLFGRDRVRLPAQRKREVDARVRAAMAAHAPPAGEQEVSRTRLALVGTSTDLEHALFRVGMQLTHERPSGGNAVRVLFGGDATYDAMGKAIDAAKHHVHAEFYLIRNDATGAWFRDRLAAAAARGVEVRLLCDGYGCFALGRGWSRPIKKAGGQVASFLPMRSVLLQPVNLRNHRKIVVVDGAIAFTGGLNVGDEYRGQMPGVGEWRDLHMQIEGPAAADLQRVFVQDWAFATNEVLAPGPYFLDDRAAGDATLAIVPSGPDTRTEAIHRLFFGAIAGARSRVAITTPYFVPDQAIMVALEVAAMRGVDVRMILPSRSNHRVTFHAGRSFYTPLLEAGVHIYEYLPGMVHAKTMVVDGALSLVGSANMDLRSFRLNFEVHTLIHDAKTAERLEASFADDLARCKLLTSSEWQARRLVMRMAEGAARLVSPLL